MQKITRREAMKQSVAAASGAWLGTRARLPIVAAAQAEPSASAAPADAPWFRRHWVGIEWGPTGANDADPVYMSRASGEQIVGKLVEAQAEYGVVFMKDQTFAYYNSKLAKKCPALGDRDLLREILDAARPHGMPIVAYCQVQYDDSSWEAHPEWRMKDSEGRDARARLCYRSGYIDFIRGVLGELMEYDIQGFHVDMLDFGFRPPYTCWCDRCRAAFEAEHGAPPPPGPTWDEAWDRMLEFRYASNLGFCRTLDAFIRETRPDISVDYNYHGYPPFSFEAGQRPVSHANNGDFVTAEGLPFVFGHTNPGLLSLFLAGARPEGALQVATSRSVYNYHDFTVRPEADLNWEVMTYLAHGVQCTVVDKADYDGSLDDVVYRRLGRIFGEARRKRDYFGHEPVQEVGLYYSQRSRDWFGRDDPPKYMRAVWGAHKALVQSHIPMGFVMDENVTPERLRRFPVVYLAGTAIVTERELDLFREYVSEGGCLLVTGVSGWYDRWGRSQGRSSLEDLIGGRLAEILTDHLDNYLRFPDGEADSVVLTADIPTDWLMLTYGPVGAYQVDRASALGEVLTAHRPPDNPWKDHMSAGEPIGPALLLNTLGQGKVVCVAGAPDAAFASRYRMSEHRNLIRNLVRYLNPAPVVRLKAPAHVESVITKDGHRLLIHLLFFAGPPTSAAERFPEGRETLPTLMEEPMPYEVVLEIPRPFGQVSAAGSDTELTRSDRHVRARVKAVHEVIVVEEAV